MPGKIGDALYALPTCKQLAEDFGEQVDFYTSSYCEPIRALVEYQPYINRMVVPDTYIIERMDMGIQPWYMPIPENQYTAAYQLGYRGIPDRALHQFMALEAGIDKPLKIEYTYPEPKYTFFTPFVTFAPRGSSSYANLFIEVAYKLIEKRIGIVVIGGAGENYFQVDDILNPYILDYTGYDMIDTVGMLSKSLAFIGLMSSQLVLANGFDFPKIAPHDGIHWDMRHVVYSDTNFYPINPSEDDIISLVGL